MMIFSQEKSQVIFLWEGKTPLLLIMIALNMIVFAGYPCEVQLFCFSDGLKVNKKTSKTQMSITIP